MNYHAKSTMQNQNCRYRKSNAQSHISVSNSFQQNPFTVNLEFVCQVAEQGCRAGEFLRLVRRILQDVQSIRMMECFDKVRVFHSQCGGKSTQTLHLVGPQEVYLSKYSNPKAFHYGVYLKRMDSMTKQSRQNILLCERGIF